MANSTQKHSPRRDFAILAVTLVSVGLGVSAPAQTTQDSSGFYESLRTFLEWSVQARPEELETRARGFNAAQLPLVAGAVDHAERATGPQNNDAYRALVRWHFWLAKHLDPDNQGFWQSDPVGLTTEARLPRHTTATLPSLEMLHLQSLAGMAYRRGYIYDSLVWWRDRGVLERRLARVLYDPTTGGFAHLDSLGRLRPHPPDLSDLLPLALGAPVDRSATRLLAQHLLAGKEFTGMEDAEVRANLRLRLDPATGWPYRPGLNVLSAQQDALLLGQAIGSLHHSDLSQMADAAFREVDLSNGSTMQVALDDRTVSIPAHPPKIQRLDRTKVALEFLLRSRVLLAPEANAAKEWIREAAKLGVEHADSVAAGLDSLITAWGAIDPTERRTLLTFQTDVPQPNGDRTHAAFRYHAQSDKTWYEAALDLVRQDAVQLRTEPDSDAQYAAQLEPRVIAYDHRPVVRFRFFSVTTATHSTGQTWTAAWTDGQREQPPQDIKIVSDGEAKAHAQLPPPPPEPGLWWVILRGPAGRPSAAPALALADPMAATVRTIPQAGDGYTSRYEVSVRNQLFGELPGRVEIVAPADWRVEPQADARFLLPPRGTDTWNVTIAAPKTESPGLFPIEWRFYDGKELISRLAGDIAVHFQWLMVGPFPSSEHRALDDRHGPDRTIQLGTSYDTPDSAVEWSFLPADRLSPDGWVRLPQSEPGSIWYALTAVSTTSRDVEGEIEGHALLRVNGVEICRNRRAGSSASGAFSVSGGANYVLVKAVAGRDGQAAFRVGLRDVSRVPLQAAEYDLDMLLDDIVFVRGRSGSEIAVTPEEAQRVHMRLIPLTYHNTLAASVSIVGNFNGWSPEANRMQRAGNGEWQAEVRLSPGEFEYKLVVDQDWIPDPSNPRAVDDGFGSFNSLLVVD